jgi:hypothetical protein
MIIIFINSKQAWQGVMAIFWLVGWLVEAGFWGRNVSNFWGLHLA